MLDQAEDKKLSRINKLLSRFISHEDGYAMVLTVLSVPVVLGVAAFAIDGSRVANLHTDLQHAVDAMALAGARELDGRNDAISRAQTAISSIGGNQAWFGGAGTSAMGTKINVTYSSSNGSTSNVSISFLGAIPDHDDTPIGSGACTPSATSSDDCSVKGTSAQELSNNAKYVRILANPQSVQTIFPLPGTGRDTISVTAEAVATYTSTACDVTPVFICNPFENTSGNALANGYSFNENFEQGNLYGRQVTLSYGSGGQIGPGNFGFLKTNGNGASVLAQALAQGSNECHIQDGIDTKPGANVGPVTTGINTRFGLYTQGQTFPSSVQAYAPDVNIRMGQSQGNSGGGNGNGNGNGGNNKGNGNGGNSNSGPSCNNYNPEQNQTTYDALSFPPGDTHIGISGGTISSSSNWDIETYWDITHGNHAQAPSVSEYTPPALPVMIEKSFPGLSGAVTPSRYDVYNYEIDNNYLGSTAPNGETGAPQCHAQNVTPERGRRVIFSAVVNCSQYGSQLQGSATNIPAEAFTLMFLTQPAYAQGNIRNISMEIIDVNGRGGLGGVEHYLREEAELVR